MEQQPFLSLEGMCKYYPETGVQANQNVSLHVKQGEIHALVGENGAGKTTLMRTLYGLEDSDKGTIRLQGKPVTIARPGDAIELGIGMVHQHFQLIPSFTVLENILLGTEEGRLGILNRKKEHKSILDLCNKYNLHVNPFARVSSLPVGLQQRVELLKVLFRKAQIIVLDEPTAVLTPQETQDLFKVLRSFTAEGRSVIFITHKLLEVMEGAQQVTIMRQGKVVASKPIEKTNVDEMAGFMVGRTISKIIEKPELTPGKPVLRVNSIYTTDASGEPANVGISLDVHEGEIHGIAGVSGNGQTEFIEAVTGLRQIEKGDVYLFDKKITNLSVWKRRNAGMAHIPEDRMTMGLNPEAVLEENLLINCYKKPPYSRKGVIRNSAVRRMASSIIKQYSISGAKIGSRIASLSGGNLQRVVLGRELGGSPALIIANQPTRGLDLGSIEFVHKMLIQARNNGAAILLVSVELDEIMNLSDRISVFFRGAVNGTLKRADADENSLGLLMAGVGQEDFHRKILGR